MESQRVGHIKEDAALATHILHLGGGEVLESHEEVREDDVNSEKNCVKSEEDDIDKETSIWHNLWAEHDNVDKEDRDVYSEGKYVDNEDNDF